MENRIEEAFASELTRADFLKRAAAAGIGLSLLSGVEAAGALAADTATQTVRWISPRGTLDVMDDFDLWVPLKMGFGLWPLIIAVALASGPMVMINSATGFRRTDLAKIALARMPEFGATILIIAILGVLIYVIFYFIGKRWASWEA